MTRRHALQLPPVLAGAAPKPQTQVQKQEIQEPEPPPDPVEDPDTLFSASYARIVEVVSEGEIEGLCDRNGNVLRTQAGFPKGIFLDETPLMGHDGKYNFQGVKVGMTWGLVDQDALPGFGRAADTIYSGAPLKAGPTGVVTIPITNSDAARFDLAIRFQSLLKQDKKTGDVHGSYVAYVVQIKLNEGQFINFGTINVQGKSKSSYLKVTSHTLPRSATPATDTWQVRVYRLTPDSDTVNEVNATTVDFLTYYVRSNFRYPYSALVAAEISARGFSAIPTRGYRLKGIRVLVPSNYFPETREYNRNVLTGDAVVNGTGDPVPQVWDGNMYRAWSNNPAWIIFDLMTNRRYGMGESMGCTADRPYGNVDRWGLYPIAQYCDETVDDGQGGLEPRFQASAYLQAREDAYKVIGDFASVFRGMAFWQGGAITFTQDRPRTTSRVYTNSNVLGGDFSYSGSSRRARHTIAVVRFNDPDNQFKPAYEYVPDAAGIAQYGPREIQVAAFACASRSQAHRTGRYILRSELLETELVSFHVALEGATLRPGDIFEVLDNNRAGIQGGGRLRAISVDRLSVTLDREVAIPAGDVTVSMARPQAFLPPSDVTDSDDIPQTRTAQVSEIVVTNGPMGAATVLTLADPAPAEVEPGGVWILKTPNVTAQKFRLMSVEEDAVNSFTVTGLEYREDKFSETDDGVILEDPDYTDLPEDPSQVLPPTALTLTRLPLITPGAVTLKISATWEKPQFAALEFFLVEYRLAVETPGQFLDSETGTALIDSETGRPFEDAEGSGSVGGNWLVVETTKNTVSEIGYTVPGTYQVKVTSIATSGHRSDGIVATIVIGNDNPIALYTVTGLELAPAAAHATEFIGLDARFQWRLNSPSTSGDLSGDPQDSGGPDPFFRDFELTIFDVSTGAQVYLENTTATFFVFSFSKNSESIGGPRNQFRIEVRGRDLYGNTTAPATLTVTNPAPAPPTVLVVQSGWTLANLAWTNPTDVDLASIEVFRGTTSVFASATLIATVSAPANTFAVTQLTAGTAYWFWVRAVDTFGTRSTIEPAAGAAVVAGTIPATDIGDFSVTATKTFSNTIVLDGDVWLDNDPGAGRISWNSHFVVFRGVKYTITAGNTPALDEFVWWRGPIYALDRVTVLTPGETVYRTSATHPVDAGVALNENDFIIATNAAHLGVHDLAWWGFANAVIGSAYIKSLAASKITAGTITGEVIQVGGVTGSLQSTNFVAGTTGWQVKGDGSAEFNNVTVRGTLDAAKVYNNSMRVNSANPTYETLPYTTLARSWANYSPDYAYGTFGTNSFFYSVLAGAVTVNMDVSATLGTSGGVRVRFYGNGIADNATINAVGIFPCNKLSRIGTTGQVTFAFTATGTITGSQVCSVAYRILPFSSFWPNVGSSHANDPTMQATALDPWQLLDDTASGAKLIVEGSSNTLPFTGFFRLSVPATSVIEFILVPLSRAATGAGANDVIVNATLRVDLINP